MVETEEEGTKPTTPKSEEKEVAVQKREEEVLKKEKKEKDSPQDHLQEGMENVEEVMIYINQTKISNKLLNN